MLFTLIHCKTLVPDPFVFLMRITVKNVGPDKRFAFLGCNLDGWSETCELCLSTFFDIIQIHEECQDTSSHSAMSVFFDVISVERMVLARLVSDDLHFVVVWNGYICQFVYALEEPFNDWVLVTCISKLYMIMMKNEVDTMWVRSEGYEGKNGIDNITLYSHLKSAPRHFARTFVSLLR